jgi:hypothetical protein
MTSRIESGQRIYDAMTDPTRICANCIHVEVCTIFSCWFVCCVWLGLTIW